MIYIYIHKIDIHICYLLHYIILHMLYIYIDIFLEPKNNKHIKPFNKSPMYLLDACLFLCLFERWDFQTCSFEVEHIGFGTSKQTLWRVTVLGTPLTPTGEASTPREDFFTAGTRGYRVIGPLWKRVASSSRLPSFSGSMGWKSEVCFPEKLDFPSIIFF